MSAAEVIQIDTSLDNWDLPVAAYNILKREDLNDIDKITAMTEEELGNLRGFSTRPETFEALLHKIHQQGYCLSAYNPWHSVEIPEMRPGYSASRDGKISSPKGRVLKPNMRQNRQYVSTQSESNQNRTTPVAVMVLSAYLGYQENHEPVYIDGDTMNCAVYNLRWSTTPSKRMGRTKKAPRKEAAPILRQRSEVNVYRAYQNGEVVATVSDDGSGSVSVGGTTLSLTATQLYSLTRVATRIGEVNALMGIG